MSRYRERILSALDDAEHHEALMRAKRHRAGRLLCLEKTIMTAIHWDLLLTYLAIDNQEAEALIQDFLRQQPQSQERTAKSSRKVD